MHDVPTGALRARCEDEVLELHRFFGEWYRGDHDLAGEAFSRASDVLAEGFHLISPEGVVTARGDVLGRLRAVHGSKGEGFEVRIENCSFRIGGRGLGVVTYEEWHDEAGASRGRLSTAVFQDRADAPNGVEWVHLHETWLKQGTS
jgi:hypothetical protein